MDKPWLYDKELQHAITRCIVEDLVSVRTIEHYNLVVRPDDEEFDPDVD